jgi:DNA (cytosine-5)-methyltransferase 1
MTHLGLFEGIGGFSLAARWMGWKTVAWCEWNEFGQRVLRHHFPEAIGYGDITKTDFTPYANRIDILTGGFPCQPFSMAGKRKGTADDRHLWPQMRRAIRETAPRYIVGENVLGLVNWDGGLVFDQVCADLEAEGYAVAPVVIPAAAVNAPHGRDRVWFIARRNAPDTDSVRLEQCKNGGKMGRGQSEMGGKGCEFTNAIETNGSKWDAPDTYRDGHDGSENRQGNNQGNDSYKAGANTIEQFTGRGSKATTPDTDSDGLYQCNGQYEKQPSQGGVNALSDIEPNDGRWNAPDTDRARGRQNNGQGKPRLNDQTCSGNYWHDFPTQSPVCGGNDGLPRELDGITFSKWRNETIKAYGNAIVPQVAYEIFKTIELYEKYL